MTPVRADPGFRLLRDQGSDERHVGGNGKRCAVSSRDMIAISCGGVFSVPDVGFSFHFHSYDSCFFVFVLHGSVKQSAVLVLHFHPLKRIFFGLHGWRKAAGDCFFFPRLQVTPADLLQFRCGCQPIRASDAITLIRCHCPSFGAVSIWEVEMFWRIE